MKGVRGSIPCRSILLKSKNFQLRKENDIPKYINVQSNHPKNIIKDIPKIINDRLSTISSNKDIFNQEENIYQEQLKEAGYIEQLKYLKSKTKKNTRKRNIIWFNPPYNQNVDNDRGRPFLNVIDGNFPKTNKLSKIINRNLVKLSYSCTQNMERIIKGHNNEIINKNTNIDREGCSCRTQRCPLNGGASIYPYLTCPHLFLLLLFQMCTFDI